MESFDRPYPGSYTPESVRSLGAMGLDDYIAEPPRMLEGRTFSVGVLPAPHLAEGPDSADVRAFWNASHGVQPDGAPIADPRTQPQGEN